MRAKRRTSSSSPRSSSPRRRSFRASGAQLPPNCLRPATKFERLAEALYGALSDVVPKSDVAEWAAQPLIQLQLPIDIVEKLSAEAGAPGEHAIQVADVTVVAFVDPQALKIFGISDLSPATKLSGLGMRWAEKVPGSPVDWVRDIEAQVRRAARNEIPAIGWGYLQETNGPARYVPLLSRARRIPALRSLQFDVNLVPFDEFAATRAIARMIPLSEVVCHRIDKVPLTNLKVVELALRFKNEHLSRMPFLTNDNCVKLMVHESMIARYISQKVIDGDAAKIAELSVAEMIATEPSLRRLFESSYAVVAAAARLRDVNALMGGVNQVQDVFVTETGRSDEPIVGWITNAMLAQDSV